MCGNKERRGKTEKERESVAENERGREGDRREKSEGKRKKKKIVEVNSNSFSTSLLNSDMLNLL